MNANSILIHAIKQQQQGSRAILDPHVGKMKMT